MNTDIRIAISFWDHPKTVKLERRLGLAGVKSLQILWIWAANNKSNGSLTNVERTFNAEDVEIAARWNGEQDTFTNTLVDLGWLDEIDGGYLLHGWSERNSWAAKADERGDKARFSRLAKIAPEVFKYMKDRGVTAISKEEYEAAIDETSTKRQRNVNASLTPAPSPAPSPSPTPNVIKDLPPTACARADDQFSMHADWTPSEYFPTLANTAGVVPPTGEELETALREFVPFWMTQKRRCTAHEWDLAFIKAIKSGFTAPKERSRSRPQALSPRQQYMQDVGNLLEEIDGIATEGCPTRLGQAVESLPGIRPQLEHAGKAGV